MRYRNIVFLDHEETETDDGEIVQDRALRILHHKTDDSVLWEMPTEESVNNALDYLLQWDYGDGEVSDQSSAGSSDWRETVTRGDRTYLLTYNVGLGYIGLEEILS